MLANIKSTYFNKLLFSHLTVEKELDIIKYNKNFQTQLGLNLKHYIFLSKNYIVYEKKNYGKEYIGKTVTLAYEGEYKNGKRNGKGKEYNLEGQLEYEGDFKNGKRDGIGKLYSKGTILVYEGEYKNGKRNGKGKSFQKGKVVFEGEFIDEEIYKGKTYDKYGEVVYESKENDIKKQCDNSGNVIFEGEYKNWKKNGKGKEYNPSNGEIVFEGE